MYTIDNLTVDDIRHWYHRYGTMHPSHTAAHAHAEFRSGAYTPTPAQESAARQLICAELNAEV